MANKKESFAEIEKAMQCLLAALSSAGWAEAETGEVQHFIDHAEYGVALETLVAICLEKSRAVEPSLKSAVLALADKMDMSQSESIRAFKTRAEQLYGPKP